ncbi:phosphoenolpyruvate--protein phosphotransferase [Stakelama sp. CBK3Z-3]|uniref:phosphoenolpyruvate--protein phosphotransferase n=1 Tax=Stakelama flava TaxID=2860338 RepID=A0ABS6XJ40_9SPHN|nr:phosphoenolpyruvate--protein phosphotransferase [Stakelama flava]MBW4330233.1 phosphoenolpyruvate--protein phosphotransferase [Stakelama flava]
MSAAILSPLAGWATPIGKVADPVFADAMLGDGIAIDPVEGRLVAPGAGRVENVHPAGHAVTLALDSGAVLLMHIGLDTVGLGGKGFAPRVAEGDRVAAGDTLIDFDLDQLARTARSLITPVIVTNGDAFAIANRADEGAIASGAPLMFLEAVAADLAAEAIDARALSVARTLSLPLAHGLHARPAARIATLAGEYDARIELEAGARSVSARSSVAMLGLALGHGATVTLRGAGPQADAAVDALTALIESGMGEYVPVPDAPAHPVASETMPVRLNGVVAVPGMAIGPAWRIPDMASAVPEAGADETVERARLHAARAAVRKRLAEAADAEGAAGEIAAAHLALIDDPMLEEAAARQIARGKSAGAAWREAIAAASEPLRQTGDKRFAERIDDFADLEQRVLTELYGDAIAPPSPPDGAILIADTLYPSQLMALAGAGLAGIVTAKGGATSHVAIIAAGIGVPMLAGTGESLNRVEAGTALILGAGTVRIDPDPSQLHAARADAALRERRREAARASAHEPAITIDGTRIELVANCGSAGEARAAIAEGGEGCGLLRTEFLFLDRAAPPDMEEQRAACQAVADALGNRPLIVRTLDIGADKPAPWLPMDAEENPALGLRGIRLQLARTELLETQLRALLAVEAHALRIMLPMVCDAGELEQAKAMLETLAHEAGRAPPPLGIMVETPAAALTAATLAQSAAFFSIGSNDLTQYALARDRTNPAVAAGLDALHPAVLQLIDATVRGGASHGVWTGVCGGIAAIPEAVPLLVGLGVSELSVPVASIAEIKAMVRTLNAAQCSDLARQALTARDADSVRALIRPLMEEAA